MCFEHDYDWVPELIETTEAPAGKETSCDECHEVIHPWEFREEIFGQQYDPDEYDDEDDPEREHFTPGETYTHTTCANCLQVRAAIRRIEEAEGCKGREAEPPLGLLFDGGISTWDWLEYTDRYRELEPLGPVVFPVHPKTYQDWLFQEFGPAYGQPSFQGLEAESFPIEYGENGA